MRTILTVATAIWIAACSLPATAGVVYNWVELEGNAELGPMTGRIEIKDKVWKSGEYAFQVSGGQATSIEDFGLISFFASARGMGGSLELTSVNNAIPCKEFAEGDQCNVFSGIDPDELVFAGTPLGLLGQLTFGELLSGFIRGQQNGVVGIAHFFGEPGFPISIVEAGQDTGQDEGICALLCRARGVWLIDRATIPVPEPSALGGLLVGLAALVTARRRRP